MKGAVLPAALALVIAAGPPTRADTGLRDLCPDRPGKATSACTLDEGYLQIESDIFNGSFQHGGGVTTDIWYVANPTLKYGVADNFDIEASLAPLVIVRTRGAGAAQVIAGLGDLFLRGKWAVIGNGGSDFALVVSPYLKIPTARQGIGDGAVEGGVLVPASLSLGGGWTAGSTTEFDVLKNNLDGGRHSALSEVVTLDRSLGDGWSAGAEIWEATNFDPDATSVAWSFDLNASWVPDTEPDLQFDGGVNLGLNRNTPGVQVYTGISKRFG